MWKTIKAFFFDLDGTVYFKGKLIEGAKETIEWLKEHGYQVYYITNTESKNGFKLAETLKSYGIDAKGEEIFTCRDAGIKYVKRNFVGKKGYFLTTEDIKEELKEFLTQTPSEAAFVLVANVGEFINYENLTKALRALYNGAHLIAFQPGKHFFTEDGVVPDTGAFTEMLALASGVTPLYLGKPSKEFFKQALETTGFTPEEVVIVGDNTHIDILGAKSVGAHSILVKTGNPRKDLSISAEITLDSIADIPQLVIKNLH